LGRRGKKEIRQGCKSRKKQVPEEGCPYTEVDLSQILEDTYGGGGREREGIGNTNQNMREKD